jgi:hypothetical protein
MKVLWMAAVGTGLEIFLWVLGIKLKVTERRVEVQTCLVICGVRAVGGRKIAKFLSKEF